MLQNNKAYNIESNFWFEYKVVVSTVFLLFILKIKKENPFWDMRKVKGHWKPDLSFKNKVHYATHKELSNDLSGSKTFASHTIKDQGRSNRQLSWEEKKDWNNEMDIPRLQIKN